jgi:pyruvate formate lyase activating enzyme
MKVKIASIVENSLVDVIGEPSFVIWFSGCNFRCPWCFALPLVKGEGKFVEVDEIVEKIKKNSFAIEYVQATGGEPTLQIDGLEELFSKVKKIGLKCSLDTNSSNPEAVERFVRKDLIDHYATDIKTRLKEKDYWKLIGVEIEGITERIKKSLEIAKKIEFVEIRTTFVPSLLKTEDVEEAWKEAKEIVENAIFILQQFYPFGDLINRRFSNEKIISHEQLVTIAKKIKEKIGLRNVYVRSKAGIKKV